MRVFPQAGAFLEKDVPMLRTLLIALLCSSCIKEVPPPALSPNQADQQSLRKRLEALEADCAKLVAATDEALWAHWTSAKPFDVQALRAAHASLWTDDALADIRRGKAAFPHEARWHNLERWLLGEKIAQRTAQAADALAQLEASATFMADGRTYAFRDVIRSLANEKSAVKRRQIWSASHAVAHQLEPAIAEYEKQLREALQAFNLPSSPRATAAQWRGTDLPTLRQLADDALTRTDTSWQTAVAKLAASEVQLSPQALTRADLPRLLKVPASIDALFPADTVVSRAENTLRAMRGGLDSSLTVDASATSNKPALPLTIAPLPGHVRISIRPYGGLRDEQMILKEFGTASAYLSRRSEPFSLGRLFNPLEAQRQSELWATLLTDEDWLFAQGVSEARQVAAVAQAHQLFWLRRTAGLVLAAIDNEDASDDAARATYLAHMTRALSVQHSPEDGARSKVETHDFLRAATQLLAMEQAAQWREKLGAGWWKQPITTASPAPLASP